MDINALMKNPYVKVTRIAKGFLQGRVQKIKKKGKENGKQGIS